MAAAWGPVQDLCYEATCPICLEDFKDPVTIPECGHNFCRACLNQFWGKSEAKPSCPQCRKTVQPRNLISNRQLANVTEIARNLSLHRRKEEEGKGRVCKEHKEPLKLFCKEDETTICLVCDKSKEHKGHQAIPLKEAFEEYKGLISSCLESLRKERKKILVCQADTKKGSQDLLELTETEKQKTVEKLRQLRQFLEEQEKCLLNEIEEVKKKIARRRDEQLARLSRELSSLERSIREMEEKRQQPASELLQDVRSTLQRYEKRKCLENPLAFPQFLKRRISAFCDINPIVEDAMKQLKDAVLRIEQLRKDDLLLRNLQRANVTLDPDTANPWFILSEDRKSVRNGDQKQALPYNPMRFNICPCVLGCEEFTAGRHFWEVTVGSEEGWAVGVARKSVRRKSIFLRFFQSIHRLSPEGGVWAVGKWRGKYMAFISPNYSPLSLSEEPKRIQVTLDYEGRRVSFYDTDSGAKFHTFSGASFSGETLVPIFCLWGNKTHFRIS